MADLTEAAADPTHDGPSFTDPSLLAAPDALALSTIEAPGAPESPANIYLDEMTLEDAEEALAPAGSAGSAGSGSPETDMEVLMRSLGEDAAYRGWPAWTETGPTYTLGDALDEEGIRPDGEDTEVVGILLRMEPTIDSVEESVAEIKDTVDRLAATVESMHDRMARMEVLLEELSARLADIAARGADQSAAEPGN